MEQPSPIVTNGGPSLDEIVAELDHPYDGSLPEQAIREAQRRREEITPRLIELIRTATETIRNGGTRAGDGHLIALFLLTEFRAKEALPAILEAVSLPGEGPFTLFDDAITEDLSRVLVILADEPLEVIETLIADRSLTRAVRWEAAHAYLYLVRDGRLTRDEAVERLRGHLRDAVANKDAELATALVVELDSYAPREALGEIEAAFESGLVDPWDIGLEDIQEGIDEGESRLQHDLESCKPSSIEDTVEELSDWVAFQPDRGASDWMEDDVEPLTDDDWTLSPDELEEMKQLVAEAEDEPYEPIEPIRNIGPKVGRNDPCPCGSGKKYKKCCGAR